MPVSKRKPKSTSAPPPSDQPPKPSISGLPVSFSTAPSRLQPLLSSLDRSRVYLLHIDRQDVEVKKQAFSLAIVVNLAILAVCLWRAYHAIPAYIGLIGGVFSIPGFQDPTVPFVLTGGGWRRTLTTLLTRMGMAVVDYLLFQLAWTWPYMFFFESGPGLRLSSPVFWRYKVGFQQFEVIVRRSRNWTVDRLLTNRDQTGSASRNHRRGQKHETTEDADPSGYALSGIPADLDAAAVFEQKVRPAMRLQYLMNKTGYLMAGPEYDIDYASMVEATKLIQERTLTWTDISAQVAIWIGDGSGNADSGQWMVWEAHRDGDSMPTLSPDLADLILVCSLHS